MSEFGKVREIMSETPDVERTSEREGIEAAQPEPRPRPYNAALAEVMLMEGDFEGLSDEVGRPNK